MLGSRDPRDFSTEPPQRHTLIRLIGVGELLRERVQRSLPRGADLEEVPSLAAVGPHHRLAMLDVYVSPRIDLNECERIERFLRKAPRRLVVLCGTAQTGHLFRLAIRCHPLGLVTVEEPPSKEDLRLALLRWYLGGFLMPDWSELGLSEGEAPARAQRMMGIVEREPFHAWRVQEIADAIPFRSGPWSGKSNTRSAAVRRISCRTSGPSC